MLHSRGVWHFDEPMLEQVLSQRDHGPWKARSRGEQKNEKEGAVEESSGEKRMTEKNLCGLTLPPLAITQGAEYSPQ